MARASSCTSSTRAGRLPSSDTFPLYWRNPRPLMRVHRAEAVEPFDAEVHHVRSGAGGVGDEEFSGVSDPRLLPRRELTRVAVGPVDLERMNAAAAGAGGQPE